MISSTCGLVDAVCFLALGGVFAEMMTGNLLLMALNRHRQVDGAEHPLHPRHRSLQPWRAARRPLAARPTETSGAPHRLCGRMGFDCRSDRTDLGLQARRTQSGRPRGRRHAGAGDGHPERHGARARCTGPRDQCNDCDLHRHPCRFHAGWPHQPQLAASGGVGRIVHCERRSRRPAFAVRHGVAAGAD